MYWSTFLLSALLAMVTPNHAASPTKWTVIVGGATAITVELADDQVQIAVEDRGNGVPEDERDIIFDRFSRGSGGGNRAADKGVGLGLALVDEHVRLHGGRFGELGTYLPGRRVTGVRIDDDPEHPFVVGYFGEPTTFDEPARRRLALYRLHMYLLMFVEMPSRVRCSSTPGR